MPHRHGYDVAVPWDDGPSGRQHHVDFDPDRHDEVLGFARVVEAEQAPVLLRLQPPRVRHLARPSNVWSERKRKKQVTKEVP